MSQIYCPDCGQPFDGEFALHYHRRIAHNTEGKGHSTVNINPDDLEKATKRIKGAVIAGIISGILTTIIALVGASEIGLWGLIDSTLIFGLTFGIHKKSRTCAVILLAYWIVSKLLQWDILTSSFIAIGIAGIFTGYFIQGILGTFAYNRLFHKPATGKPGSYDLVTAAKELQKDYAKDEINKMKDHNEHILLQ